MKLAMKIQKPFTRGHTFTVHVHQCCSFNLNREGSLCIVRIHWQWVDMYNCNIYQRIWSASVASPCSMWLIGSTVHWSSSSSSSSSSHHHYIPSQPLSSWSTIVECGGARTHTSSNTTHEYTRWYMHTFDWSSTKNSSPFTSSDYAYM